MAPIELVLLSSSELAGLGRPPIDLRRAFGEPHGEPLGEGSNFCQRLHIVGGCEDEQLVRVRMRVRMRVRVRVRVKGEGGKES